MAEPLETTANPVESKDNDDAGQTSTVSTKADFSKLAMLDSCDQIFIKQPVRTGELLCEMFCGCEVENFYEVMSVNTESNSTVPLFNLKEESNCCLRQCCGAQRPLVLNATFPGQEDEPIFIIDKPYRVGCFCCDAKNCMGRNYMEVWIGDAMVGSVQEKCLCNCRIAYGVHDENDNLLCTLERCACYCECMEVGFEILTPDGEETGKKISKLYGGMLKELFTTNDQFLVEFPDIMKTTQKKLLLCAAAMMIEFRHFENKKKGDFNSST